MIKKRYLILILFQLFITTYLFGQNDGFTKGESDLILAKAGVQEITVGEFRDRYEFMPHLNYSSDNQDTIKKEFLYSLIAEKFWSLYGLERRFDTLDVFKSSMETLRRLLIKDELYKSEIESKIRISSEEISEGLVKIGNVLSVNLLSSTDSSEIFYLDKLLAGGADFDSLLRTRKEYDLQKPSLSITFGSLEDERIEDILYKMKPGGISNPVKSETGWFIFKLIGNSINNTIKPNSDEARNKVFTTIKARKRKKVEEAYLDSLLGGRRMEADGKIFNKIYDTIYSVLQKKYDNQDDSTSDFNLSEKDIYSVILSINNNELNLPFVEFNDGYSTANDFLYYLYYQKVHFNSINPNEIRSRLSLFVRQFIEDEILIREGIKRGIGNSPEVKKDVDMWKEYYLAKLAMQSLYDSVSVDDKELADYSTSKKMTNSSILDTNLYKSEIKLKKIDDIITRRTIGFAKKYQFTINERLLSSLKLSELNTFTYRLIGFGGRIAALPITIPMYEWYYKIENEKLPVP